MATQPLNTTFSAGWCVSKCAVSDSIDVQFVTVMLRCTPFWFSPLLPPVVIPCRVCEKRQPLIVTFCEALPTTMP